MPDIYQHKDQEPSSDMAAIFAALGDDTRLVIVSKLQDGSDRSISNLTEGLSLTRQGVSRHLRVLEKARLVRRRRVGRETRYQLEAGALSRARDYLARASSQWDHTIDRLARHLET
ncbi:ArsR/SmtB family transcription factor [Hoeflea sp.]|uniref:ArsR/SmtB family transcription factor n=1 Tax=Hoeflea sp. TaxID=1940281 RepID=UPI003B019D36